MGTCLCGEEYEERGSRFRPAPFPNGGREQNYQIYQQQQQQNNPHFHSAQFQQLSAQEQDEYYRRQQQQQQQLQQQQDPRSPHYAGKTLTGENTRISMMTSPNGGATHPSQLRRDPGQTPGPRPEMSFAPIDMDKTVVYRTGSDQKTAILKTPRGNTARSGTGRGGGGGGTTPRTGRPTNVTPRSGGKGYNGNDPYGSEDAHQHHQHYEDENEDDEMILICADCFADVMDERCPRQCPVSGKMHV